MQYEKALDLKLDSLSLTIASLHGGAPYYDLELFGQSGESIEVGGWSGRRNVAVG